jgi:hypothetical protein
MGVFPKPLRLRCGSCAATADTRLHPRLGETMKATTRLPMMVAVSFDALRISTMKPARSSVCAVMFRLLLCALAFAMGCLRAEEPRADASIPAMRELAPGVFEIGSMRLDKKAGTLTFPGKVNMDNGALEYLICTPKGPTHESLLVTEVQPSDVHFGMLLLGAKGAGILTPAPSDAPPAQIDAEYLKRAPKLKGDNLTITARWKDKAGTEHGVAVEDWIVAQNTGKRASRGPWIYTGSMFAEDKFLAQLEGVIGALVTNPSALINNPRSGNDNDQIWMVNAKAVPPQETPVEIIIKLEAPPKNKSK